MIKLPSLRNLSDQFSSTIARFQWVTAVAICKTAVLIRLAETTGNEDEQHLMTRLSYALFLALPLTLGIQLLAERKRWTKKISALLNLSALLVLAVYFFTINKNPNLADIYTFALLLVGAHLIVAYLPFFKSKNTHGFWQYNKTLFLQFLNATLYSVTLFIGLIIAIETIEFLFNVTYLFKAEQDLFIVIAAFFHTVFFLSKIPLDLDALEQTDSYPAGLKIFTQYVLLPLEVVYMVILYAYTIKIIFEWKLPEGGVAYLVMAFSIAGILALLLLHPLQEHAKEKWVRLFSRRFYIALLPLIVLLFIGIFRRIHDYGITENRLIIAVLACWLALTTIYFLVSKRADIRWIPASLSALAILLVIGPWNISAVARKNQIGQFHEVLIDNKLLNEKNQVSGKKAISDKDYDRLISIIQFHRRRELNGLEPYFAKLSPKHGTSFQHYSEMEEQLSEHLISKRKSSYLNGRYLTFSSRSLRDSNQLIEVEGFSKIQFFDFGSANGDFTTGPYRVSTPGLGRFIEVYKNNQKLVAWDLSKTTSKIKSDFGPTSDSIPVKYMTIRHKTGSEEIMIIFQQLNQGGDYYSGNGIIMYK